MCVLSLRVELKTSRLLNGCSNQLSYESLLAVIFWIHFQIWVNVWLSLNKIIENERVSKINENVYDNGLSIARDENEDIFKVWARSIMACIPIFAEAFAIV